MTIVQHRALTPDGKVIEIVTLEAGARWMPRWPLDYGEPAFETRILPDGQWEPSAIIRQPGKPPAIVTWGMS
jgi:hypothetical protein